MTNTPITPATHAPPTPALPRRTAPPAVRWRSWPIAEGGWPVGWLTARFAGVVAAVGLTTSSVGWSVAAGGLLAAAAWRCFIPVEFEINSQGISQVFFGRRHRIPWKAIGSCEVCRAGLWFAPPSSRWPYCAGLYVPFGSHRSEIQALVEYYLSDDETLYSFDIHRGT